jgi:hypothetical protein
MDEMNISTDRVKIDQSACVEVKPGICGFHACIQAKKIDKNAVVIKIKDSECKQIKKLSDFLQKVHLKDLFLPLTRNPVYIAAEKSGCHPSCIIPAAILKVSEVALRMALPSEIRITYKQESANRRDS